MNKLILLFSLMFCVVASHGGELYRFPSGLAAWTIEFKPDQAKAGEDQKYSAKPAEAGTEEKTKPVFLTKEDVTQDGEMQKCEMTFSNGKKREIWVVSKLNLILTEDPAGKAFATGEAAVFGDPFSPQAFGWLKPGFLQNPEPMSYRGKHCFYYKGEVERPNLVGDGAEKFQCEAWIDAETLLPVALDNGEMLGNFNFKTSEVTLTLPAKFQKRLDYFKLVMGME